MNTRRTKTMKKADKNKYFYAVQVGKKPGIYKTWAECEEQTKGFNGAIFKKFITFKEARLFCPIENELEGESQTEEEEIGDECMKCGKSVKQSGVICEECKGWWHFKCDGTTKMEVEEKYEGKDYLCQMHRQEGKEENDRNANKNKKEDLDQKFTIISNNNMIKYEGLNENELQAFEYIVENRYRGDFIPCAVNIAIENKRDEKRVTILKDKEEQIKFKFQKKEMIVSISGRLWAGWEEEEQPIFHELIRDIITKDKTKIYVQGTQGR